VLAITDFDLYKTSHRFVFGDADEAQSVAVVSVHRLRSDFYGEPSDFNMLSSGRSRSAFTSSATPSGSSTAITPVARCTTPTRSSKRIIRCRTSVRFATTVSLARAALNAELARPPSQPFRWSRRRGRRVSPRPPRATARLPRRALVRCPSRFGSAVRESRRPLPVAHDGHGHRRAPRASRRTSKDSREQRGAIDRRDLIAERGSRFDDGSCAG